MKRKYYMRGLGFGILITTLVFSFLNTDKLTDEDVIKRAEKLGYVLPEQSITPGLDLEVLKEKQTPAPTETPIPTEAPQESVTPVPTKTEIPTQTPVPTETEIPTEIPAPTELLTEIPAPTELPTETPTPTVAVVKAQITIVKGNTASKVCRMIEEAGIIEEWEEFRDYLKSRELVNEINVGTFTLSSDMSFEEIAKTITGK